MKKVWVNGTFDILHVGHTKLLKYAASLGELRVGIDTDNRVKELKGTNRPFNNVEDRMTMLLALKSVDDVKVFGSDEELVKLIRDWNPDYMVVGSDYKDKEVIGGEWAKEVIFFNRIGDYSTTKIIG